MYLNGELQSDEVLYMCHPPGYHEDNSGCVLCLLKSLYSLEQAGHCWYQKFVSIFNTLRFMQCKVDQAVFYKCNKDQQTSIVIAVHVDDCMIAGSSLAVIKSFKSGLHQHIKVTNLGKLHWMLRIKICHNQAGATVHLLQCTYINSILCHYGFEDAKPVSTPFNTQVQLTLKQALADVAEFAVMHNVPYCEAVDTLNWVALTTCSDIAFTVLTVARFSVNPSMAHWNAVKLVFRYLAGMHDLWLTYSKAQWALVGYADADGSMSEDHGAITGFAFLIDSSTVSWSSKKQEIISLSATESEYMAAMHGMKEGLWLQSLLTEIFKPFTDCYILVGMW